MLRQTSYTLYHNKKLLFFGCKTSLKCKAPVAAKSSTTLQAPAGEPLEPVAGASLDFTDHRRAFKGKSLWELSRALLVLGVCSYQSFSVNSAKVFDFVKKCFGIRVTSVLVKPLFYNQFVGGVSIPDIKKSIEKISTAGSGTIILMVLEAIERTNEAQLNYNKIVEMMEGVASERSHDHYMQVRLSALFTTPLLKELSMLNVTNRERFIRDAAQFMETGTPDSLDWLTRNLVVSADHLTELLSALKLLEGIGQKALDTNTVLMADAEYTYINPALTALALALALRCNITKPVVWNTTQCYLKSSFESIQWEEKFAERNKIHYGAKLVRGAYLTPESKAAEQGGYPCPVHDNYENTGRSYDKIAKWLIDKIHTNSGERRQIRFVLASHNQGSIRSAIQHIKEHGIKIQDKKVIFAQTYGMCDHITYTLGQLGYPVHKSLGVGTVSEALPYLARRAQENMSSLGVGTVSEALPYLARRAQENMSFIVNSRQERQLLKSELAYRIGLKK